MDEEVNTVVQDMLYVLLECFTGLTERMEKIPIVVVIRLYTDNCIVHVRIMYVLLSPCHFDIEISTYICAIQPCLTSIVHPWRNDTAILECILNLWVHFISR